MFDVEYIGIVAVAAVVAFVASGLWYGVFGNQLKKLSPAAAEEKPMAVLLPVELARNVVLAGVLTGIASVAGIVAVPAALGLGLALWIGFPIVLWTGAIFHENVPWRLAALHAGDWLLKLVAITAVIGVWR